MDFIDRINKIASKTKNINKLETEEATKNALIMPFIHSVLEYDVFDPDEVIPEFTSDVGTKKGEKVDYAIKISNEIQILIECKKYGETLTQKHASQLYRYFSVVNARIAILTNGSIYQFYTDIDAPNKMDDKPFLTLDIKNIDKHLIPEVKKISKPSFDIDSIISAAGELKYLNEVKVFLKNQFNSPDEDLVKFIASNVYVGILTPKVKKQFMPIVTKALKQFLNDSINDRLQSALSSQTDAADSNASATEEQEKNTSKIVTTAEEIEGYNAIKAILRQKFDVKRITARDTQSYFGILLDDNNRKPLCRLHFNAQQKYLGIFENGTEDRLPIEKVDDIFSLSSRLIASVKGYE